MLYKGAQHVAWYRIDALGDEFLLEVLAEAQGALFPVMSKGEPELANLLGKSGHDILARDRPEDVAGDDIRCRRRISRAGLEKLCELTKLVTDRRCACGSLAVKLI